MTKDSIQNFQDAFKGFLKEENLETKFNEKKLIASWNEVMGKPIASRTSKIFIRKRVIYVKLTSAPLKQELTISKEKVLEMLEKNLGSKVVDDVRFL